MSTHLTYEQAIILASIKEHEPRLNQTKIAKMLWTTQSTVSRELKRAKDRWVPYNINIWKERKITRAIINKDMHTKIKYGTRFCNYLLERLKKTRSPEQICGKRNSENPNHTVVHQTVYRWLYENEWELVTKYFRRKGKKRRKNSASASKIPNRISIHKRPQEINARARLGDFENDTIVWSNRWDRIVTSVCRRSRIIFADILLQQKDSSLAIWLSVSLFKIMKEQPHVHSFTNDNGTEFTDYEYLDNQLGTQTFFADPYSSRQRWTNEYHNSLIREFFPKWTDFSTIDPTYFTDCIHLINSRPRKCLNRKTPYEVYYW